MNKINTQLRIDEQMTVEKIQQGINTMQRVVDRITTLSLISLALGLLSILVLIVGRLL